MKDSSKREQDVRWGRQTSLGLKKRCLRRRRLVEGVDLTSFVSGVRVPKNDLALRDYMRLTSSLRILSLGTEMPPFNLVCLGPPSLTSLSLEVY
ncbi:hypothetical protein TNCV_3337771 [Trichonephila clavipes]|nr:hypothetical protein TNCV_3337771 [Trichonephila clavipes]